MTKETVCRFDKTVARRGNGHVVLRVTDKCPEVPQKERLIDTGSDYRRIGNNAGMIGPPYGRDRFRPSTVEEHIAVPIKKPGGGSI